MVDIHITVTGPVTVLQADTTAILARLAAMEATVTDTADFLNAELPKLDTLIAGLADISADVAVLLAKAAQAGVFTAEEQAAAEAVTTKLEAVHTALSNLNDQVGDQDGSDSQPPAEPTA